MGIIKNSLGQSHDIIKLFVRDGDAVIDATAGNGHDTLFLAQLVGQTGVVYSFDIQDYAIERTSERLKNHCLHDRVRLIKDGHQNMDSYIKQNVKAVMFNLGYLPGGLHSVSTRGDTTIEAVKKAMDIIMPGGVISIVVYFGGDSGFDEKEQVMEFIDGIDCSKFTVMKTEFVNQINCPPILVCIEKK